ncbi:preprotein translocase subunit YajC, partial [Solicola sp. PLA-1-18]|uniref:preprotein translocase subunit YajC n=1 Tax=Solicola sp. PLA-1-18 TaxID=3380532 RepID=UPI003B7E2263
MSADQLAGLLPLVLLVLVFWFLVLRPARKRQREAQQTQQSLELGARVMITSGIFGTVTALGDETFSLEVAPGVVLEVLRPAVARILTDE